MQEALKNPHYKKIWERVMLNRHPEAKSLEEALEMEAIKFEDFCLFQQDEIIGVPFIDINDCGSLVGFNFCTSYNYDNNRYINLQEEDNTYDVKTGALIEKNIISFRELILKHIIGRQITLEDILILLSNLEINEKIRIRDIDITFKNTYLLHEKKRLDNDCVSINIAKHLESEDEDDDEEPIDFDFELTKPLHEQTLEIWESVSKLID